MDFLRDIYDTEGPLGIPMKDKQAQALEALLKDLPKDELYQPGHLTVEKATTELLPGERADVSWISTEDADRYKDIVISKGMNDEHFKLNPVVTLQHCYWTPPVGRSLWRKAIKDGSLRGIKAKTVYPTRPDTLPELTAWIPDEAFPLVQAGLLNGKSIGFIPTKVRYPTDDEREKNPALKKVFRIIEEWLLLEYACCYLPCNQQAVVEAVSKGLFTPSITKALNIELPAPGPVAPVVPFTPMEEIEKAVDRRLCGIDADALARRILQGGSDLATGKV